MATLELRVAVWTVDTYTGYTGASRVFNGNTTLLQRMGLLQKAVEAARQGFRTPGGVEDPPYLNIFLGPEYLFVRAPDARVLTMGEADVIERSIRDLSKGMLLIPGTVVWKKPAERIHDKYPEDSERGARALKRRTEKYYTRSRVDKALESIEARRLARLAISSKEQPGAIMEDRVNKEAETVSGEVTSLSPLSIVRNTAYGYYDTVRVLKYHKRANSTEVLSKDSSGDEHAVFIPGQAEGYFEVAAGGLTVPCGIEICLDHGTGFLSNAVLNKTPLLHFITSASTFHFKNHGRVPQGGYVIHASSRTEVSGVFTHTFDAIEPAQRVVAASGTLLLYTLKLEV